MKTGGNFNEKVLKRIINTEVRGERVNPMEAIAEK